MQVLAALLRAVRSHACPEACRHALKVVLDVDLIGLLINSMLASADADPRCRVTAAAAAAEVTGLAAASVRGDGCVSAAPSSDSARACLPDGLEPALKTLLQCLVRNVGMPQQRELYLCRHRHLLRLSMTMLLDITRALPCEAWAGCDLCSTQILTMHMIKVR